MQTVHIWPVHHLLLENNEKARRARRKGAAELLVVIVDGQINEIMAPPEGQGEFRNGRELIELIERAWKQGSEDALAYVSHRDGRLAHVVGCEIREPRAPWGWILWQHIKPGMLVHDGYERYVLRFPTSFEHAEYLGPITRGFGIDPDLVAKLTKKLIKVDTANLATEKTTGSVFTFDPQVTYGTEPYWKMVRENLTQEQCHETMTMCKAGDYSIFSPTYQI